MSEGTDIQVSPSRRHIIKRPRLTRLLDETKARCILLVAPAGYGKTTLAREWLSEGRDSVWYRATTTAADPVSLIGGLARATGSRVPDIGKTVLDRVRKANGQPISVEVLVDLLQPDLRRWPADVWLAVDDYHHCCESIDSEQLFQLIALHVPLLITSRQRPGWITAREVLYGEALVVETKSLAMTIEETAETLPRATKSEVSRLVALTKGWPALIGLAALLPPARLRPEGRLPSTLFEYFADEVFASLDGRLRTGLTSIAFAPHVDVALSETLLGRPGAAHVLREGQRLGFIIDDSTGTFVLHPLLRRFLVGRLEQVGPQAARDIADQIIEWYVHNERWDDSFAVIAAHGRYRYLARLIERAMYPLFADGRLDTVRRWLDLATQRGVGGPLVDLAQAEVAFRRGHSQEAEILATQAADALGPRHPLYPRALIRAGQSAQFDDRPADALAYQARARARAKSLPDRWDSTWGAFVACLLLENEELDMYLTALSSLPNKTVDHVLRMKAAAYNHAQLAGGLGAVMGDIRAVWPLVARCSDPVIATSFLNACAFGHVQVARYDTARDAARAELDLGNELGLPFVRPHALCNLARAELGQHQYADTEAHVEEVETEARRLGDVHNQMEACVIRACSSLFRGDHESALRHTAGHWERLPTPAEVGEYLAVRGLAFACAGSHELAAEVVSRSESATRRLAVETLNAFTRVIISLRLAKDDVEARAHDAFHLMRRSGVADSMVIAYRGYPDLLTLLRSIAEQDAELRRELDAILTRAGDRHASFKQSPARGRLTPREQEVYALVAKGYSNREIADELVISEVTAKVHVRRILKKLAVRSRTEAAIRRFTSPLDN